MASRQSRRSAVR